MIKLIHANARGIPCGESHSKCIHSDLVVDHARRMRAAGMTYLAIGQALGVKLHTVANWCLRRRRRGHVRMVAKRVTP